MTNLSEKVKSLKQSGIRSASVRCAQIQGINLGQGVCDLPIPDLIKQAAYQAVETDKSMYSPCEGIFALRKKISEKLQAYNHIKADPEKELLITHGSTGAFVCTVTTIFNPGDEIILFEPFYGYHKHILELQGLSVRSVPINLHDFSIDFDVLAQSIGAKTRGIVVCTPNNPTGKVYSYDELLMIGRLAEKHNLWLITDEIYEYITYPGYEHISLASLQDFKQRTVNISGFSKTYNMTGWRLGYVSAPAEVISKMALVQDLYYVCPSTPLQYAVLAALDLPDSYYQDMRDMYLQKRDEVVTSLREFGYRVTTPQGAYYLLADISQMPFKDDQDAAEQCLTKAKVAVVPGRAFYSNPEDGKKIVRICYALQQEKVAQALKQLSNMLD